MASNPFIRIYRRILEERLTLSGFHRKGSDFLRERNGLLQMVVLHKSNPWTFTGEFAMQPLVYPFPSLFLDFGGRIDDMDPGRKSWWDLPEEREGIEKVVRDFTDVVVKYVIPWLDRFQTCQGVVEVDLRKQWKIRKLDYPTQAKDAIVLGLCALRVDMFNAAKQYLTFARTEYRKFLKPDDPEWFKADLKLVEEYLEMLSRDDLEGIRRKLDEGEAYTRKSLGLPPKG